MPARATWAWTSSTSTSTRRSPRPTAAAAPAPGPVGVKKVLEPYLPVPRVVEEGDGYALDFDRPKSIGRVRSFYGNFLVIVKALAYILSLGPDGLKEIAEIAVLNANYIRKSLEKDYHLKYTTPTLHECVFSDKFQKDVRRLEPRHRQAPDRSTASIRRRCPSR